LRVILIVAILLLSLILSSCNDQIPDEDQIANNAKEFNKELKSFFKSLPDSCFKDAVPLPRQYAVNENYCKRHRLCNTNHYSESIEFYENDSLTINAMSIDVFRTLKGRFISIRKIQDEYRTAWLYWINANLNMDNEFILTSYHGETYRSNSVDFNKNTYRARTNIDYGILEKSGLLSEMRFNFPFHLQKIIFTDSIFNKEPLFNFKYDGYFNDINF
jgi:hypothetical protein